MDLWKDLQSNLTYIRSGDAIGESQVVLEASFIQEDQYKPVVNLPSPYFYPVSMNVID